MTLISLYAVQAPFCPHAPLPWNVLNGHGQVLWPRGHQPSFSEFISLGLEQGLFADETELRDACTRSSRQAAFFEGWAGWELRLALLLGQPRRPGFPEAVRQAAAELEAWLGQDPDKALFAVLRHDHSRFAAYGVAHALHAAVVSVLLARDLGWDAPHRTSLVGAALTMNLSILQLQGTLAAAGTRPTAAQRTQLHQHPDDSAALLAEAGLADAVWLDAVRQHHETVDGTGYPRGQRSVGLAAQLLHLADVFTAKHAARRNRQPLPATDVMRTLQDSADPLGARLARLLGDFPPGCFVQLAGGGTAVVLRRAGPGAAMQLAVLQDAAGQRLERPALTRAPAQGASGPLAVARALDESEVLVRLQPDALYALVDCPLARAA
jgi:hypothetical protein